MIYMEKISSLYCTISCCEESCLSSLGVNHDIMKKELSLVCHMKHSEEKSFKTTTFFPRLSVSLLSSVRSSTHWSECFMGKLYVSHMAVLERTWKLTSNIKLGFKAMTAKDKVNFECSLSRLIPYMVKMWLYCIVYGSHYFVLNPIDTKWVIFQWDPGLLLTPFSRTRTCGK